MNKYCPMRLNLTLAFTIASSSFFTQAESLNLTARTVEIQTPIIQSPTGLLCNQDSLSIIQGNQSAPVLSKLDLEGRLVKQYPLSIENRDWQALAQDEEFIYIADVGNATGTRKDLSIYRMDKGFLGLVDNISIQYENNLPESQHGHEQDFDAAAITLDEDTLYLFSKEQRSQKTFIYRLNVVDDEQTLNPVHTLHSLPGPVKGAAFDSELDSFYLVGQTRESEEGETYGFVAIMNITFVVESIHVLPAFSSFTAACAHDNGLWLVQPSSVTQPTTLINATFD